MKSKRAVRLLEKIIQDLGIVTSSVGLAAVIAKNCIEAGRREEVFAAVLDAEPTIFDAGRLINLATYVNRLGGGGESDEALR